MHAGYVAGRYRDGSWSDHWTDVRRCAAATFTAYRAACRCGWAGPARAANTTGYAVAATATAEHHEPVAAPRPTGRPRPRPAIRLVPAH